MPITTRLTDPPHLRISAPQILSEPGDGPLHWLVHDTHRGTAPTHAVWTAPVDDLHRRLGATPQPVTQFWGGGAFTITTTPSAIERLMNYATRLLNQLGCTVEDVTTHLSTPSMNPAIGHITIGARTPIRSSGISIVTPVHSGQSRRTIIVARTRGLHGPHYRERSATFCSTSLTHG